MIYSTNDIKAIHNDLTSLNEVRILDKNYQLVKTIIAKRIEEESPYIKKHIFPNQKKKVVKKIKASDLIEFK